MSDKSHILAVRAANIIVKEGVGLGLSCDDILVSCETTVVIIILAAVRLINSHNPTQISKEFIDIMAQQAQERVKSMLTDAPYDSTA